MSFKRTAIGLMLPSHHLLHDREPYGICVVCRERGEDGRFFTEKAYLDHVMGTPTRPACSDRHPETIKKLSPALSAPGLFDENYEKSDLEWKRWLEENDVAIREGRKNDRTSDGKRGG